MLTSIGSFQSSPNLSKSLCKRRGACVRSERHLPFTVKSRRTSWRTAPLALLCDVGEWRMQVWCKWSGVAFYSKKPTNGAGPGGWSAEAAVSLGVCLLRKWGFLFAIWIIWSREVYMIHSLHIIMKFIRARQHLWHKKERAVKEEIKYRVEVVNHIVQCLSIYEETEYMKFKGNIP